MFHSRSPRTRLYSYYILSSVFNSNCMMRTAARPNYPECVARDVDTCKGEIYILSKPAGTVLRIADIEDTVYRDCHDVVKHWGIFYLPGIVNMKVFGVVTGTSCPCDELVLMTCEDKRVYSYDGEELHLVASASKTYYSGEAFKHMTKEDWDEVKKGTVGRRLDREHHERVTANKSRFLENLRLDREKVGVIA